MLQQQHQVNDYADYNDSSDGIGSSLSSSPAPSLTESTSSSNCSSPNKFTYSTPYTSVNTKSQLLNNNKSNEQYFQQQQQAFNRYIPNQNYNQQLYNYQNYYTNINSNNSFNDSCYQSKNNSFNRSYETQNTTKSIINSLSKFSIEAILAKPSNNKQNSISVQPKQQHQEPIKEKSNQKKRASNNIDLEMSHNNKRIRTIFTQEQLDKLEIEFLKQQYMVGSERTYLAHSLNLTESQVKIWFQNRRIKWRKTTADEQAQEKVNKIDESEIINETNSNNTSTCSNDDE